MHNEGSHPVDLISLGILDPVDAQIGRITINTVPSPFHKLHTWLLRLGF